jgi:hypothetical protein
MSTLWKMVGAFHDFGHACTHLPRSLHALVQVPGARPRARVAAPTGATSVTRVPSLGAVTISIPPPSSFIRCPIRRSRGPPIRRIRHRPPVPSTMRMPPTSGAI